MQIYNFDLTSPIQWFRNKAPRITSMLTQKAAWYDSYYTAFWNNWTAHVFNAPLAQWQSLPNFGLRVWSAILNLPTDAFGLYTKNVFWGFGNNRKNFIHFDVVGEPSYTWETQGGNFFGGGTTVLIKPEIQKCIRLKYYACISNGTVPMINAALQDVFSDFAPNLRPYLQPGHKDMTMVYYFPRNGDGSSTISDSFASILVPVDEGGYGLMPSVAGVEYSINYK